MLLTLVKFRLFLKQGLKKAEVITQRFQISVLQKWFKKEFWLQKKKKNKDLALRIRIWIKTNQLVRRNYLMEKAGQEFFSEKKT